MKPRRLQKLINAWAIRCDSEFGSKLRDCGDVLPDIYLTRASARYALGSAIKVSGIRYRVVPVQIAVVER